MSEELKKPGVAFWTAVAAFVAPALYVLSIGPACWVSSSTNAGASAVSAVYRPVAWGMSRSERIAEAISWYARLGSEEGWSWFECDFGSNEIVWRQSLDHEDSDGLDKWLYSPKYRAINRNLGVDYRATHVDK